MKRLTSILFSLLVAAGGAAASAQETNSTISLTGQDFSSFDIIARKNIFDQSRVGITSLTGRRRQPVIHRITVDGINADHGVGEVFFVGHDEPLREGDHFSGFEVGRITPDQVQLTSSNKTVILDMDNTNSVRRVDDGPWETSAAPTESADISTNAAPETAAATPGAADAPRPGESAIERKLRLRREQEEK